MALKIPGKKEGGSLFPHNRDFGEGINERGIRPGQSTVVVALDGSGDAETIKEGISLMPSEGGIIYLKEGLYVIDATVLIPANVSLEGTGYGTHIQMITDNDICIENLSGGDNVRLANFRLTKSGPANDLVGIKLTNCDDSIIENVWIESMVTESIALVTCDSVIISKVNVNSPDSTGIVIAGSNCIITSSIASNNMKGVEITGSGNIVSNCQINNNVNDNLHLNGADNCVIVGNQCNNSADESGILLSGTATRNIIEGNFSTNNANGNGYIESAAADNKNVLVGNVIHTNNVNIVIAGANTINANNLTV